MIEKELTPKELSYRPKANNSYFITNAIMEAICSNNMIDKELDSIKFRDINFYQNLEEFLEIDEILNKSKNIIKEATRIIRIFDLFEYKKAIYKLSTKKWFNQSMFSIQDSNVLKEIAPLLLYYIGNNQDASYITFFGKIDTLIEYIIKPSVAHNSNFEIENLIIEKVKESSEFTIFDKDGNQIKICAIQIKFSKNSFNDKVEKILVYELYDGDDTLYEISLDKIILKEKNKIATNFSNSTSNKLAFPTTNLSINTNFEAIQEQFTEVILECNSLIHEYLRIKPLKNMKVFDTEEKLKEFQIKYEIKPKDNNFYIVAQDRKEMIISTVLHTLPYARIINNNELNDEIISRFKKYAKDIGFKICNETPPNDPNNLIFKDDSSKNALKKSDTIDEKIESNKVIKPLEDSKEQEKINKFNENLFS